MKHKKYQFGFKFILILSTLLLSTVNAQSSYLDSLDGRFALQFQINENFTLTDFQGAIFSGKYHLSKRSAIRLGFSMNLFDSNGENETIYTDTTNINYRTEDEWKGFGFDIRSQFIQYASTIESVGFYFGGGPRIGFGKDEFEIKNPEGSPIEFDKYTNERLTFGVDILVGIEWSFHKYMTLSVESGINFYYSKYEQSRETDLSRSVDKDETFGINPSYLNFGISVYF